MLIFLIFSEFIYLITVATDADQTEEADEVHLRDTSEAEGEDTRACECV